MPEARRTDPETSHSAAASVLALREKQRDVWAVLVAIGPSTDTALVSAYQKMGSAVAQQSESGIRTRRKELWALGFIKVVKPRSQDDWHIPKGGDQRLGYAPAIGYHMQERLATGRYAIIWEARP